LKDNYFCGCQQLVVTFAKVCELIGNILVLIQLTSEGLNNEAYQVDLYLLFPSVCLKIRS
jgi:hypothetical protein